MKKLFILLILPLCFFGIIKKAKANSSDYEIRFEQTECYVPVFGNVYDYLPEAYVVDTYTDEVVSYDVSYSYDYQGIKFSNIDTTKPCHAIGFISCWTDSYEVDTVLQMIDVYVYDDVNPTVSVTPIVRKRYNETINIMDYIIYSDNVDLPCNVVIDGDYEENVIGDYNMSITVTDRSNNATQRDFIIRVYDDIAPVIDSPEVINVSIFNEFNKSDYISVYDEYDGNIDFDFPDIDTNSLKEMTINFMATDSSNNITEKTVIIKVVDNIKPTLIIDKANLDVMEDYDFLSNVVTASDNYDILTVDNINIIKKKIGTQKYLVTYNLVDSSNNETNVYCYANISYYNKPIIEAINLDDLKDVFDPLYYVNCYDEEDGSLNDKVMVVEVNYKEKYAIYEVYDSDCNLTRKRIDFVTSSDLEKYEKDSKIVFPSDVVDSQTPISNSETVKSITEYKSTNNQYLYYIVLGVFVFGILLFIIIKHFKKKVV